MRITIDESLKFMRSNPEIKDLMMQGLKNISPNQKRKNSIRVVDVESRAFKKLWSSVQGAQIRLILEQDIGARIGVRDAAELYFSELRREMEKCEKAK